MSETITEGSPRRSGRIILKSSPIVSLTDMNTTPNSSQLSDSSRPASVLKKKRVSFEGMEVDEVVVSASAPGSADRKQQTVERVPLPEAATTSLGDITDEVMEEAAKISTAKSVGQLLREVKAKSQSPGTIHPLESVDSRSTLGVTTEIPEVMTTKVKSPGKDSEKIVETGSVSKTVKTLEEIPAAILPIQLGAITAEKLADVIRSVQNEQRFEVMVEKIPKKEIPPKKTQPSGKRDTVSSVTVKRPLIDLTELPATKRPRTDGQMMFTAPLVMFSSQQPAAIGYSPNSLVQAPSMSITPLVNNAREIALSANIGKFFT
jgi:hypothetical protein